MHAETTSRGFVRVSHPKYGAEPEEMTLLVQESSAIGNYPDSWERPGSSFLWVGQDHHLDREEVGQLVAHLQHWLAHGRLPLGDPE